MGKKKARIDKDGYVTFLNDEDGLSAKDYLMLLSTIVFFGFVIVGLIMVLLGKGLDDKYIELLGMVDAPLITIISAITGSNIVQYVTDKKKVSTGSKLENDNVNSNNSNEYQNNNNNYYDGGI